MDKELRTLKAELVTSSARVVAHQDQARCAPSLLLPVQTWSWRAITARPGQVRPLPPAACANVELASNTSRTRPGVRPPSCRLWLPVQTWSWRAIPASGCLCERGVGVQYQQDQARCAPSLLPPLAACANVELACSFLCCLWLPVDVWSWRAIPAGPGQVRALPPAAFGCLCERGAGVLLSLLPLAACGCVELASNTWQGVHSAPCCFSSAPVRGVFEQGPGWQPGNPRAPGCVHAPPHTGGQASSVRRRRRCQLDLDLSNAGSDARTHMHAHKHMHARAHAHTHTRTHTRTHTHMHTHTRTYATQVGRQAASGGAVPAGPEQRGAHGGLEVQALVAQAAAAQGAVSLFLFPVARAVRC